MNQKELAEYYWLRLEIEDCKKRLLDPDTSPQLAALIGQRLRRCVEQLQRIGTYIDAISDEMTRQIFLLRFCEGMSWQAVAAEMGMRVTSAKQRVCRQLKNNEETTP